MDIRELGNRLRERRARRGLTQSDIANALGVSPQAVSKWERGENAPDISLLVELGRLLGVSVEWILGGTSAERDTFPAAVFCTGLKGFAERASQVSPRELAAWANGIYYAVTEALLEAEGVPIKYLGDGFLGFLTGTDCCERAVRAAVNAKKRLGIREFVTVINYGEIYLGTIGHPDYASPDILGQAVNTAFLALPWVAENTETGVGITESVYAHLRDKTDFIKRGSVPILGMAHDQPENPGFQVDHVLTADKAVLCELAGDLRCPRLGVRSIQIRRTRIDRTPASVTIYERTNPI